MHAPMGYAASRGSWLRLAVKGSMGWSQNKFAAYLALRARALYSTFVGSALDNFLEGQNMPQTVLLHMTGCDCFVWLMFSMLIVSAHR